MKKLLRIDASAQRTGSHSRALADYFQGRWLDVNPGGEIVTRDLAAEPLPHLDGGTIAVFYAGGDPGQGPVPEGIALSDELIGELKWADDVLVSSAVYNFNVTSSLKAWIDHVVRFGHTLGMGEKGPVGLLAGKSVCLVTARGGNTDSSPDFLGPSVQAVFKYMGFERVDWIPLEGTKIPDGRLDARIAKARAALDEVISGSAIRCAEQDRMPLAVDPVC